MTLRLLKPQVGYLRSTLVAPLPQRAANQTVERLRGSTLTSMRKRVLLRAGGLCECPTCMAGLPRQITWDTFELDHVVRVADGGSNALENLRAVHVACHARLTARQNAQVNLYGTVLDEPAAPGARRLPGQDTEDMPC